jgi:Zn-dependent M16 (insulinase) family peptidase
MYSKFLNIETGKTFVAGSNSQKHYEENKAIKFLGTCNEDGTMIRAENENLPEIPKLEKKVQKEIQKTLSKKAHQVEEKFSTSDERDEDS